MFRSARTKGWVGPGSSAVFSTPRSPEAAQRHPWPFVRSDHSLDSIRAALNYSVYGLLRWAGPSSGQYRFSDI